MDTQNHDNIAVWFSFCWFLWSYIAATFKFYPLEKFCQQSLNCFNLSVSSFFLLHVCRCRSGRHSIFSSARHQPSRFWMLLDQSLQSLCLNRWPRDASGVVSCWSSWRWSGYAWQPEVQPIVCLRAEKYLVSNLHLILSVSLCLQVHVLHIEKNFT